MSTNTSLQPRRLNHFAYATLDMDKTHKFWTEVMGCNLLGALEVEETGPAPIQDTYVHAFYGLKDGSAIAFFELAKGFEKKDDGIPKYTKHLALSIDAEEDLKKWQDHFKAHDIPVLEVDHDGIWLSLYVTDPAGLIIEITYQTRPFNDDDVVEGFEVLERWRAKKTAGLLKE
jgi:catechol 2,3-dioxygenase-like lactoylglutathione lyase family enzyme